jgi:uncharacterized membrane protein
MSASFKRMMVASPNPVPEIRYIIRPNRSMDRRQARWLVISMAAASFAVAGSLALRYGAWPILPFAGLETALLAFVIWRVQARNENEELLVLGTSHLDLTRRHGRDIQSHRFNRHWVRVNLRKSRARNVPSRLEIGSHGKFVEIGSFLTDDERVSLANSLLARLTGAAVNEHGLKSTGES